MDGASLIDVCGNKVVEAAPHTWRKRQRRQGFLALQTQHGVGVALALRGKQCSPGDDELAESCSRHCARNAD